MANITFSKLGLKKPDIKEVPVTFNEQTILVKQYLPINDKLTLAGNILNENFDPDIRFYNTGKINVSLVLWTVRAYTNLELSDKQLEDPAGTYDTLLTSGVWKLILKAIPSEEFDYLQQITYETIEAVYKYQNSAFGMLKDLSADFDKLELDSTNIKDALTNPESLKTLKEVITKLG